MKIEQIKVVAGLILQNNKLLICQRPNFKDHPLKWEFPGGKIKNDETNEEALIREINEELSKLDKWVKDENKIKRTFEFKDFADAFTFMTRMAIETIQNIFDFFDDKLEDSKKVKL